MDYSPKLLILINKTSDTADFVNYCLKINKSNVCYIIKNYISINVDHGRLFIYIVRTNVFAHIILVARVAHSHCNI